MFGFARITHQLNAIIAAQAAQEAKLSAIFTQGEKIMSNLTDLQASVAAVKSVDDSAIALLGGLKAQLDAAIAANDPAALAQLSTDLGASTAALAAAVAANTPAAAPAP